MAVDESIHEILRDRHAGACEVTCENERKGRGYLTRPAPEKHKPYGCHCLAVQEWLWCETWCGNHSKAAAKTIDLCNNPLTKEPKLTGARRIVAEWPALDAEVATFTAEVLCCCSNVTLGGFDVVPWLDVLWLPTSTALRLLLTMFWCSVLIYVVCLAHTEPVACGVAPLRSGTVLDSGRRQSSVQRRAWELAGRK